jgi:hypothetical protein
MDEHPLLEMWSIAIPPLKWEDLITVIPTEASKN